MSQALQPRDTSVFQPAVRLLARLARVAEQACQASGISLPQYRLLVAIAARPRRPSDLAAQLGVSRPTLSSLVDGLEQARLLRRVPVPTDRRGVQLVPTAAGRDALDRAERALTQRMSRLVEPDGLATLAGVVQALGAALDRERPVNGSGTSDRRA